jgi:hypothetical protein
MKVSELRPCDNCGGKIAPSFFRLKVTQALINADAVNEFLGMHQFFGGRASHALVENFAPKAHDAVLFFGDKDPQLETTLLICVSCAIGAPLDLGTAARSAWRKRR